VRKRYWIASLALLLGMLAGLALWTRFFQKPKDDTALVRLKVAMDHPGVQSVPDLAFVFTNTHFTARPASVLERVVFKVRRPRASGNVMHVEDLQGQATILLKQLGPGAKGAIPALNIALQSEDRWTRQRAVEILGTIGPSAPEGVFLLIDTLDHPSEDTAYEASKVLVSMAEHDPVARELIAGSLSRRKTSKLVARTLEKLKSQ
jgi:HEAT repeat protein